MEPNSGIRNPNNLKVPVVSLQGGELTLVLKMLPVDVRAKGMMQAAYPQLGWSVLRRRAEEKPNGRFQERGPFYHTTHTHVYVHLQVYTHVCV